MEEHEFRSRLHMAETFRRLTDNPEADDYWRGFIRGTRRLYHGEAFGTEAEHNQWLTLADDRAATRRGYRDGFAGADPVPPGEWSMAKAQFQPDLRASLPGLLAALEKIDWPVEGEARKDVINELLALAWEIGGEKPKSTASEEEKKRSFKGFIPEKQGPGQIRKELTAVGRLAVELTGALAGMNDDTRRRLRGRYEADYSSDYMQFVDQIKRRFVRVIERRRKQNEPPLNQDEVDLALETLFQDRSGGEAVCRPSLRQLTESLKKLSQAAQAALTDAADLPDNPPDPVTWHALVGVREVFERAGLPAPASWSMDGAGSPVVMAARAVLAHLSGPLLPETIVRYYAKLQR